LTFSTVDLELGGSRDFYVFEGLAKIAFLLLSFQLFGSHRDVGTTEPLMELGDIGVVRKRASRSKAAQSAYASIYL